MKEKENKTSGYTGTKIENYILSSSRNNDRKLEREQNNLW